MQMKYIRLAKGLKDQINHLIPLSDLKSIDKIIAKSPNADFYTSLYRYEDRHYEQFKREHSVKGIRDVTTPRIFFDFDDGVDINNAKKDTVELCARLIEQGVPEDKIRVYFSGNKGFHVELFTDKERTRQEFYNIVANLSKDLKSFDHRINDEQRVLRRVFTKHPKSGLYKIPLTTTELTTTTVDEIREWAKIVEGADQEVVVDENFTITLPEEIEALKNVEYRKVVATDHDDAALTKFDVNTIDFSQCPRWMAKERYALQEGFFYGSNSIGKGERNTAFMILAATYKNQGFSPDHTTNLLMATAEKQAKRTGEAPYTEEQMKQEIISTVFSSGWKGGIYGRDEELLQITRQRFNLVEEVIDLDLVDISNVGTDFKDFAKNIDRNTIKTGLKTLDDNVLITSGMMVSLLAAPGAGKTSFANMFVEHLSQIGESTLYFSLDMYKNLLFARLLQRYSGYDMRTILHMYKEDNADESLTQAYAEVLKSYSNAYFNFRSGPTVEEIEQEIVKYQQEKGKDVKLVVIDYLEKVRGPFADSTANSAYVASRLSDIAKKYHTTVLLLVQPQKSAGDPREELISYRKIKGASVIEQDSRIVLTMSRPGYDPKDMSNDNFATISVVKNNMGNLSQLDFGWDGVKGELSDLDSDSRKELAALRKELEEKKREANDDLF